MTPMKRAFFPLLFSLLLLFPASAGATSAAGLLGKLPVRAETRAGYDRDLFDHWLDFDSDGCDTRDEVLLRQDLSPNPRCDSPRGSWYSAYDGLRFSDPSGLDVDHFVPLAEAWDSGARRWRAATRDRYANDLYGYTLLAVSAASNRSKSDGDPADWMPALRSFRCTYVARWVAVKYRWRLAVDRRELRFLRNTMRSCRPGQLQVRAISRARISLRPGGGGGENSGGTGTDPRFGTCTAARAAGYGPYVRGRDPEYDWYRDADGDGTVCE